MDIRSVFQEKGRFDVDRAREQMIPQKFWSRLQKGEIIEEDGRTFTPDMVLGADRRGLKVTYCTDTRPVPVIAQYAKDADLLSVKACTVKRKRQQKQGNISI